MDYVWAVADLPRNMGTQFFVVPRSSAQDIAESLTLFRECATWGALRQQASPEKFKEIAGLAGYADFSAQSMHLLIGTPVPGALETARAEFEEDTDVPDDNEAFNGYDLGPVADGDSPSALEYLMELHLPAGVIDAHGERYDTNFNGMFARFDAAAAKPVVEALVAAGHTCAEDPDLIVRAIRD